MSEYMTNCLKNTLYSLAWMEGLNKQYSNAIRQFIRETHRSVDERPTRCMRPYHLCYDR